MLEKLKYIKTLAEVRYSESEIRRPLGEQMPKRKAIKEKIVETVKNASETVQLTASFRLGSSSVHPESSPMKLKRDEKSKGIRNES